MSPPSWIDGQLRRSGCRIIGSRHAAMGKERLVWNGRSTRVIGFIVSFPQPLFPTILRNRHRIRNGDSVSLARVYQADHRGDWARGDVVTALQHLGLTRNRRLDRRRFLHFFGDLLPLLASLWVAAGYHRIQVVYRPGLAAVESSLVSQNDGVVDSSCSWAQRLQTIWNPGLLKGTWLLSMWRVAAIVKETTTARQCLVGERWRDLLWRTQL